MENTDGMESVSTQSSQSKTVLMNSMMTSICLFYSGSLGTCCHFLSCLERGVSHRHPILVLILYFMFKLRTAENENTKFKLKKNILKQ